MLALATVLTECSVLLAPHQSSFRAGLTILIIALVFWLGLSAIQRDTYRKTPQQYRREQVAQLALAQFATLLFALAGAWVLLLGEDGFGWFLPGVLLCYLVALTEAWALLIEIKR